MHQHANRRVEQCFFSGAKIYPGHGKILVRIDSRSFRYGLKKSAQYHSQRKNPRKFSWTALFRLSRKKGTNEEKSKRRHTKVVKPSRPIVGAPLDMIRALRNQTDEHREKLRNDEALHKKATKEKHRLEKIKQAPIKPTKQKLRAPQKIQAKSR